MKSTVNFRQPASHEAAFTYLELLVVLMIIGVLAMIGLSASVKLSNQTKIAECSNHLRQLNLAHLLYAADNGNNLPALTGVSFWPWDLPAPAASSLIQYGLIPKTMYCPGTAPRFTDEQNFATPGSLWNFGAASGFRVIGYALTVGASSLAPTNRNSTTLPQPTTIGSTVIPAQPASQRVLTADANLSQDGINFTSIPGGFQYNGSVYPHICPHLDGAYPAGGNVGMLDGHVEWRAFKDMKVRTTPGVPFFYW
jgi:prepilin-type N-terminal cleavage/methylation domain-containing protein/prepilin-type processing-associated H-X9-DG protein